MLKPDRPFGTVNLTFGDRLADSENDWYRISPYSQEYQNLLAKQYTGFKNRIDARKKVYVKRNKKLTTFKIKTETQDELKDRKRKAEDEYMREFEKKRKEAPAPRDFKKVPGAILPEGPLGLGSTGMTPPAASSVAGPTGMDMLMDGAPLTSQVIVPSTLPQVPPLKIPWTTLVKFGLTVGDLEVFGTSLMVPVHPTLFSFAIV